MTKENSIDIPMDIYESPEEIVIIVPFGGVAKNSIEVYLEKTTLSLKANRIAPQLKPNLSLVKQESFWGEFEKKIPLPQNVYFEKINSKLTAENILIIIVPKIIIPDKVKLDIEYL